ncbi:MAG: phosphodiester glycosidase family protein [Clostridia bacterium]|nr:phosphodiester glycosidase family protein [Clostridia bacterium]
MMKNSLRFLFIVLIAVMLLALPLLIPSGSMLSDYQDQWMEWSYSILRVANAEEPVKLPIDLTPGMQPNPDAYTEDSYEDESISVKIEHYVDEEKNLSFRIAYIKIADASQLRTGVAGQKLSSSRTGTVQAMAEKYQAVLALNGDYYINDPNKTSFEYRMGTAIRSKTNTNKDILIIDENGDFHIILMGDKKTQQSEIDAVKKEHQIINAFTFGPALVKDGNLLTTKYSNYNPNANEPRIAIGQMDTLSYVVVIAEGRGKYADGLTHQEFADFMFDHVGCLQAYNLDGGNSGTVVLGKTIYKADQNTSKLRDMNDCIYFATTVDPSTWSK